MQYDKRQSNRWQSPKRRAGRFLLFTCLCLLVLAGCRYRFDEFQTGAGQAALGKTERAAVDSMARMRAQYVNQNDEDGFMALIDEGFHPTYAAEQQRWLEDAWLSDVERFTCTVSEVTRMEGEYWHVRLAESYRMDGTDYVCDYPAVVRVYEEDDVYGAYLCGYDFEHTENEYINLYYTNHNKELVSRLLDRSQSEIARVHEAFSYTADADEKLLINLYPGQKHMIWSIKPSLPTWVGGWTEPDEAIKMCYFSLYSTEDYAQTLAHEATHAVVNDLSGNNAGYWLHEGLAGLFELDDMNVSDYDKIILRMCEARDDSFDFDRLMSENYDELTDEFTVGGYYASCHILAKVIYDECGMQGVLDILSALKGDNLPGDYYTPERIEELNRSNLAAIKKATGLDESRLEQLYAQAMQQCIEQ